MNKEEIKMSYIAGLIDGDGSISIIKEKRAFGFKYYPCIQLSNVFEEMVTFLYKTFGGSKKIKTRQKHCKKEQYVWCVRGFESCNQVIEKILPYLVLKKTQAKILQSFIKELDESNYERVKLEIQASNNAAVTASASVVKQAKKNTEDPIFWAYFSGILDTEGSFSIRKNKPSWGCVNYKYNPLIQLTMASFSAMNFIRSKMCLGNVCFPKASCTQRGYVYKISFGRNQDCIDVIKKTLPFLRFKKHQALELLRFCELYKPVANKQKGVSIEELDFREGCYQKIKQLNEGEIYKPSLIDSEARQGDEAQG